MTEIGMKVKLLTAYYPQMNKQMERINQTLETYLRHYINHNQKNWI